MCIYKRAVTDEKSFAAALLTLVLYLKTKTKAPLYKGSLQRQLTKGQLFFYSDFYLSS